MRRLNCLFVLVFALVFCANFVLAQDYDLDVQDSGTTVDVNGHYYPRTDSPTGMRQCGVTEADVKARGFTVLIVLESPAEVSNMEYCNKVTKRSGRTNRLGKRYGHKKITLGPGARVYANPNRPGVYVAAGCLNEFNANIPVPPPVVKKQYCKDSTMTIEEAKERGYKVVDGRCTMPPVMCKDRSEMTQAEARERGYTVTADGRCIMPPRMCKDSDMTLAQAREKGYTVTEDGRCLEPIKYCKDSNMTQSEAKSKGYEVDRDGRCFMPKKGWSKKKKVVVGSVIAGGVIGTIICIKKCGGSDNPPPVITSGKTTPTSGSPTPDRPRVITYMETDKAYQAGSSVPSASQQSNASSGQICGFVNGVRKCVGN